MNIKEIFKAKVTDEQTKYITDKMFRYSMIASGMFVTGLCLQRYVPDAPQFLRHHLTNLADGFVFGYSFTRFSMQEKILFFKERENVVPKPLVASGTTWSAGLAYEILTVLSNPERTFDYVDMTCYTASIAAFLGCFYYFKDKALKNDFTPA